MNRRKMELALDQNYGGVMSWHLTADIEGDNPLSLMRALNDQIESHDQRKESTNLALNRTYEASSAQDTVDRLFDEVDFRSGRAWNMDAQTGQITVDFEEFVESGKVRLLLAMTSGIKEGESALNLEFLTRDVETTTSGAIKIDQAKFGVINQSSAQTIEVIGECEKVTVKPIIDKPDDDDDDDVSGDGEINIADLALIAYYYQAKLGDDNWEVAKKADVNQDNIVDIKDLTLIAQKILAVN